MPDYGATERVRSFVAQQFIEPARSRGEHTVTIHAGKLGKLLEERKILSANRFPIICGAIGSPKFAKRNRIHLKSRQGPSSGLSSSATFTFAFEPDQPPPSPSQKKGANGQSESSASNPNLFIELRGILKTTYKHLGGAEAFHKAERESWDR
jgi:hypothetical protein